jgi:hypothetical protein
MALVAFVHSLMIFMPAFSRPRTEHRTLNQGLAVNSLAARSHAPGRQNTAWVQETTSSWLSFVLYSHMTAIEAALSPWTETIPPSRMASGSTWCILDLAKERQSHF